MKTLKITESGDSQQRLDTFLKKYLPNIALGGLYKFLRTGKIKVNRKKKDPKYVLEKKLDLDYLFYITNQIMKPSIQFLEQIAMNPEKLFENYINKEINRRKNVCSILDYICEDNVDKSDKSDEPDDYTEPDDSTEILKKKRGGGKKKSKKNTESDSETNDNSTEDLINELEEELDGKKSNKSTKTNKSEKSNKTNKSTGVSKTSKDDEEDSESDEEPKINKSTKGTKSTTSKTTKSKSSTKSNTKKKTEDESSDDEIKKRKQSNKITRKSLTIEL